MDLIQPGMLAIGLSACAGLRAWLPLLGVGLLSRWGYVPLDGSFEILKSDSAIVTLSLATIIEAAADKVIVLDNLLDSLGTFLRPIAGAVVAAGMFTSLDPTLQAILGIVLGGGTALTVHAGKAALRGGTTALAPAHGGLANSGISFVEDVVAVGGIWLAVIAPLLLFVLALVLIFVAYRLLRRLHRAGRGFMESFRRR